MSSTTDRTIQYTASIAETPEQVREAQRLRYRVFAGEFGATLNSLVDGLDVDEYDEACDHLIVRRADTEEIVGTYRLLPPGRREGLYSDSEFDLSALDGIRDAVVETGRSCVHPEHRTGAVITQMWAALGRYALLSGHRYLAGAASVPLHDGGATAANAWRLAEQNHASPQELRVRPLHPWNPEQAPAQQQRPNYAQLPPLFRGYLRLGAWVCGPPAHDPEFNVADFFTLLQLDRADQRYVHYFLGDEQ
ncbi:GNAT family N-acetyltransferase [Amycolatopsis aidingensis]|uniref:GNAT family N-acetyltransferase n=1 Tax=Amycolatopsis aidingensis TaxID=2842453 RepID=UPI001C0C009F|nr:GNAT family N-acyltransferase [Amycolatopsis aidingensis]